MSFLTVYLRRRLLGQQSRLPATHLPDIHTNGYKASLCRSTVLHTLLMMQIENVGVLEWVFGHQHVDTLGCHISLQYVELNA